MSKISSLLRAKHFSVSAFLALYLALILAPSTLGTALAGDVKPKYGPAEAPRAEPLSKVHGFFQNSKNSATHFWELISFYIPQFNNYSCSSASLTMVLNAARAHLPKKADDRVISEKELLDKVNVEHWKDRLNDGGYKGEYGSTLDLLGRIAQAAFKEYGFPKTKVQTIHVSDAKDKGLRHQVLQALKDLAKGESYLIVNFDQQAFTDDTQVGHFAPVAAFDEKNHKVLILDPDREFYEPYWVSFETFMNGMATIDTSENKSRGLLVISPKK